ncbi:MAG TPA: hypothetical protein VGS06_24980 [Streptosporangiaceae bacterium]|nr:hypothetical protein [Streptosporangiaceae bacterium]
MRALVVYESMYGNTHVIATYIAAGLCRSPPGRSDGGGPGSATGRLLTGLVRQ